MCAAAAWTMLRDSGLPSPFNVRGPGRPRHHEPGLLDDDASRSPRERAGRAGEGRGRGRDRRWRGRRRDRRAGDGSLDHRCDPTASRDARTRDGLAVPASARRRSGVERLSHLGDPRPCEERPDHGARRCVRPETRRHRFENVAGGRRGPSARDGLARGRADNDGARTRSHVDTTVEQVIRLAREDAEIVPTTDHVEAHDWVCRYRSSRLRGRQWQRAAASGGAKRDALRSSPRGAAIETGAARRISESRRPVRYRRAPRDAERRCGVASRGHPPAERSTSRTSTRLDRRAEM